MSANRHGFFLEPVQHLSPAQVPQYGSHAVPAELMVVVEPLHLLLGQQLGLDHLGLDGDNTERLKCEEDTLAGKLVLSLRPHHLHQVLNPDAEVAVLVVARLVGEDHSLLETWVIGIDSPGDPTGPLVDVEEGSDPVTGAVEIVQSNLPEVLPGETVQAVALGLVRELSGGQTDISLQDSSEAFLLVVSGSPVVNSPSHVSRPVPVLSSGVQEVQLSPGDPSVRLR